MLSLVHSMSTVSWRREGSSLACQRPGQSGWGNGNMLSHLYWQVIPYPEVSLCCNVEPFRKKRTEGIRYMSIQYSFLWLPIKTRGILLCLLQGSPHSVGSGVWLHPRTDKTVPQGVPSIQQCPVGATAADNSNQRENKFVCLFVAPDLLVF